MNTKSTSSVQRRHQSFLSVVVLFALALLTAVACKTPTGEPVPLDPPVITRQTSVSAPKRHEPSPNDSIGIGDKLEIFVSEDQSLNGIYEVREKGDIIMPRLGRIPVEKQSVAAVEKQIAKLLEDSQLQHATVIVDRVGRAPEAAVAADQPASIQDLPKFLVYFTGHVKRPGQHWITLPRGQPVGIYEATLISGGLARFANDKKVEVLRKGNDGTTKKMMLDLDAVKSGEAPDPPLHDGDIIFVPEKKVSL